MNDQQRRIAIFYFFFAIALVPVAIYEDQQGLRSISIFLSIISAVGIGVPLGMFFREAFREAREEDTHEELAFTRTELLKVAGFTEAEITHIEETDDLGAMSVENFQKLFASKGDIVIKPKGGEK